MKVEMCTIIQNCTVFVECEETDERNGRSDKVIC